MHGQGDRPRFLMVRESVRQDGECDGEVKLCISLGFDDGCISEALGAFLGLPYRFLISDNAHLFLLDLKPFHNGQEIEESIYSRMALSL